MLGFANTESTAGEYKIRPVVKPALSVSNPPLRDAGRNIPQKVFYSLFRQCYGCNEENRCIGGGTYGADIEKLMPIKKVNTSPRDK